METSIHACKLWEKFEGFLWDALIFFGRNDFLGGQGSHLKKGYQHKKSTEQKEHKFSISHLPQPVLDDSWLVWYLLTRASDFVKIAEIHHASLSESLQYPKNHWSAQSSLWTYIPGTVCKNEAKSSCSFSKFFRKQQRNSNISSLNQSFASSWNLLKKPSTKRSTILPKRPHHWPKQKGGAPNRPREQCKCWWSERRPRFLHRNADRPGKTVKVTHGT